ncbi:uncharacterized protein PRCAT00000343001 [Priceomyces carsonii]|uniref:uncharacterized protein n=1 Tax=Priceomyces carsonii TaxID=28549 RepID=UPI002ED8E2F9|nr:unnamed protein product [Priceomyces carsonii]
MSEKYSELPDIDYLSQEVFETSDVQSIESNFKEVETPSPNQSSDIIEEGLSNEKVRDVFTDNILVSEINLVDFLGDLGSTSLGGRGYRLNHIVETSDQKLSRIKRELEELRISQRKGELQPNEENETNKLMSMLEDLSSGPDKSHLNEYKDRINELFKSSSKYMHDRDPIKVEKESITLSINPNILELDRRINSLEKTLGADALQKFTTSTGPNIPRRTIENDLRDLRRKVSIITNPRFQLDSVKVEIESLKGQLEDITSKKQLAELTTTMAYIGNDKRSNPHEAKVNALFERLNEFDKMSKMVPLLIKRLKSLHVVHSDLSNCIQTSNGLEQILTDMKGEMREWDNSLNKLNTHLDLYEKNFDMNESVIEKWVADLEQRIAIKERDTSLTLH